MHDQLLSAIEVFYECVGRRFDYERAVAVFSRATDDTGICLAELRLPGRFRLCAAANIPDEAVRVMTESKWDAESHGVVKHYAAIPEGVPLLRRTVQSDDDYYSSRMYREASEPWGLHSEGGCLLQKGLLGAVMYGFVRNPGQEEVDHEDLSRMTFLNGHLWRAMRLHKRLDTLEQAVIRSNNVLDLLEHGLVLYAENGTPLFVNRAAQRIFDKQDGLDLTNSGINIRERNTKRQFDEIMQALVNPVVPLSARAGGIIRVTRPSRKKPFSLMIVPLKGSKFPGFDNVGVAVLLFDPSKKPTTVVELFVSSYGLTPAEATLARDLAQGVSLDEFSAKRGITRNTAKTQLHAIFAKTDTSRQPELVSLLLRSIAGLNLD